MVVSGSGSVRVASGSGGRRVEEGGGMLDELALQDRDIMALSNQLAAVRMREEAARREGEALELRLAVKREKREVIRKKSEEPVEGKGKGKA